ncbi:unnamed protein product [Taenia asiatica]|uniref:tRNA-binding domain-containing protein n=1 Tax=Taenia asiatica TaxID=60517 RepID=A0A0R3VXI9_TAEAS|nr:unnamed protein product [Taenia asiatica]
MTSEKFADIVGNKIALLTICDESAIKQAELVYAERNAQLKREIDALKEKLDNLETMAGSTIFGFGSYMVISFPSFCKVDLGEGSLRTVVSGLVPHVPIERMQGLVGIFVCNLKPVKMRGIESQGMLMCAADASDKIEPLVIESPTDLTLGDKVYVQDYPGEPDAQLHPKRKVWEQVMPDMRVDSSQLAIYKGVPWRLRNSPDAIIKAPTVVDAQTS